MVKNQIENEKEESLDDVTSIKSQIEEPHEISKSESHDQLLNQTHENANEIPENQAEIPEQLQDVPNLTAQHANDENEKLLPENGEVLQKDEKNISIITDKDMPESLEKNPSDEKMPKDIDSIEDENRPDLLTNEDSKGFQETAEEIIDELHPEEPKMKALDGRIYK